MIKLISKEHDVMDMAILSGYYQELEKADIIRWSFYDKSINCFGDFVDLTRVSQFYIIVDEGKFLGHVYLNDFRGKTAWLHFGLLSPKYTYIAEETITSLAEINQLSALIGCTPMNNRAACRFVKRQKFEVIAEVPDLIFDAYDQEFVTAMITMRKF